MQVLPIFAVYNFLQVSPLQCDPARRALLCYKNIMEWFPIA